MRRRKAFRWIDPRLMMGDDGGDAARARDRIPPIPPISRHHINDPRIRPRSSNILPLSPTPPQKTSQTRYLAYQIERILVPGKQTFFFSSVRETTTRIRISLGGRVGLCSHSSFRNLIDWGVLYRHTLIHASLYHLFQVPQVVLILSTGSRIRNPDRRSREFQRMDAIMHDGMDVDVDMDREQEQDRAGAGLKLPVSTNTR